VNKAHSLLTWSAMRGDAQRDWYRMSDLYEATLASGRRWTLYQIRQAIKHVGKPKVKKYSHFHYTQAHMDALLEAIRKEVSHAAEGGDKVDA
jgi:hypothetical protein